MELSLEQKAKFVYNSNRIENIKIDEYMTKHILEHAKHYNDDAIIFGEDGEGEYDNIQTINYKDEQEIHRKLRLSQNKHFLMHTWKAKHVIDHGVALDYILDFNHDKRITSENIKEIHSLLMKNIYLDELYRSANINSITKEGRIDYDNANNLVENWKQKASDLFVGAGEFRKTQVKIPLHENAFLKQTFYPPPPNEVQEHMSWLDNQLFALDNKESVIVDDCWEIHNVFECIHPFIDGNGRTGRLLLNLVLLRYNHDFHIVEYKDVGDYYKSLKIYQSEHDIGKIKTEFYEM